MQDPIQALWLSVLMVGLEDARRTPHAEEWLWSPDFDYVCALAQTTAEDVRNAFYRQADAA